MPRVYGFRDYDKYLCLKVGLELWLVIIYSLHPILILVSSFSMGRRGASGAQGVDGFRDLVYADDLSLVVSMLATIPALIFLYVWANRKPGARLIIRRMWRHGSALLVVSILLSGVIVLLPVLTGATHKLHPIHWAQVCISVGMVCYLRFSRRVKDTFSEFPDAETGRET